MQNIQTNNINRFLGYSDFYNQNRPVPPVEVVRILTRYLSKPPKRVVDVGCGSGLSSFIWLTHAKEIIGVEPNDDMRETAISHWRAQQEPEKLRFINGISDQLGLDSDSVDILTCSQSFHWMDPQPTLHEFARVLRTGGVFAAYDCDWPPTFTREVEEHYQQLIMQADKRVAELAPAEHRAFKWDKNQHLQQIHDSGLFSFSKEIVFHHWESCDATRYANIAVSQGGLQTALKLGAIELDEAIQAFQHHVQEAFASKKQDVLFSYRMRLGIK